MAIPIFFIPKIHKVFWVLMPLLALVLAGTAIMFGIFWAADKNTLKEYGRPDFNTLTQDDIKEGMIVTGDIELVIDYYAVKYESGYSGVRTSEYSEELYYLIPICDTNADDTVSIKYFITYQAKYGDYDIMGDLIAQTWSDAPPTAKLTLENARVKELPLEAQIILHGWMNDNDFYEHGSFINWCIEYNIFNTSDVSAIASKLTNYMIYRSNSASSRLNAMFICAGLSVLLTGILIIMKIKEAPGGSEEFSKLRELDGQSIEGERHQGSDF